MCKNCKFHVISLYQNGSLFRHIVPPEAELPVLRGPPRVEAVVSQRQRVRLATRHRNHPVGREGYSSYLPSNC